MSLIDPAAAGCAVPAQAAAPAEIPRAADLEDGVVAAVQGEGEAACVGFPGGGRHDGGVEEGDDGARGEFPEASVACAEEVEV